MESVCSLLDTRVFLCFAILGIQGRLKEGMVHWTIEREEVDQSLESQLCCWSMSKKFSRYCQHIHSFPRTHNVPIQPIPTWALSLGHPPLIRIVKHHHHNRCAAFLIRLSMISTHLSA